MGQRIMIRFFGRPPSLRRALRAAENFNLDSVTYDWWQFKEMEHDLVLMHERELKRFLVMRGCFPKMDYMPYGDILLFWQMFILYTETYANFCETCIGRYVHFDPLTTDRGRRIPNAYADFYADYRMKFRQEPDPNVWPDPNVLPIEETLLPLFRRQKQEMSKPYPWKKAIDA